MKMHFAGFLMLGFVTISYAATEPKCPTAAAIKAIKKFDNVSITPVDPGQPGVRWEGTQRGQVYDTVFHWTFTLYGARGASKEDANRNLLEALDTLENQGPPIVSKHNIGCLYSTNIGRDSALAMRPIK